MLQVARAVYLCLILAFVSAQSYALTPNQVLVLLGGASHFRGTTVDLNFANGPPYYTPGATGSLAVSRASIGTNLLPTSPSGASYTTFANNTPRITQGLGDLVEEGRTNYLLHSTAPATQTTGSLAIGTYTLWVNGSGSATVALGTGVGCGISSATQGNPISFTLTVAGTCIITVSGSLNEFQLELNPGTVSCPTSFIPTAGAIVPRAADITALPVSNFANPSIWAAGIPECPNTYTNDQIPASLYTSGTNYFFLRRLGSAAVIQAWAYNGTTFNNTGSTVWPQGAAAKSSTQLNGSSLFLSYNGAASTSGVFAGTVSFNTLGIGQALGTLPWNGYISRVAISPQSLLGD